MAWTQDEQIIRELCLGFIKVHVVDHVAKEQVCGAWLTRELPRHSGDLGPGTLCPALHHLERDGCLSTEVRGVKGRHKLAQLVREVLYEEQCLCVRGICWRGKSLPRKSVQAGALCRAMSGC